MKGKDHKSILKKRKEGIVLRHMEFQMD